MPVRNSWESDGPLYSAAADLDSAERDLAVLMFISGLDAADMGAVTVDDIYDAIVEGHNANATPVAGRKAPPPNSFLATERTFLMAVMRRLWRSRHIALAGLS